MNDEAKELRRISGRALETLCTLACQYGETGYCMRIAVSRKVHADEIQINGAAPQHSTEQP